MDKLIGYELEIKQGKILSVQINLLNKCTSKCKSCRKYTWPNDELSPDDLYRTLRVLKLLGLKTVVLSGGEPLLYKNIIELVNYIYDELKLKCSIITTCITNDDNIIDMLGSEKIYRVHLSLDACNRQAYKEIRGVDAFDIVDRNIKAINAKRIERGLIPIRFSTTVSEMNYKNVKDIYDYAIKNKCIINYYLVHTFDFLKPTDEEDSILYNLLEDIVKDEKERNSKISNARELIIDYKYGEKHRVDCKCYIPSISCVINANGDIYPCCRLLNDNGEYNYEHRQHAYGNIVGKSVRELFVELKLNEKFKYPLDCEECKECGQRYYDMIRHLDKVKTGRKDVLFV